MGLSKKEADKLIVKYQPLIRQVVYQQRTPPTLIDDMAGVANLRLCRTAQRFDGKKADWKRFLQYEVIFALRDWKREHGDELMRKRRTWKQPMPKISSGMHEDNFCTHDSHGEIEARDVLEDIKKNLSEREYKIVFMYYGLGLSMNQLAQQCGITESRVSQLIKSIKAKLVERYGAEPVGRQVNR